MEILSVRQGFVPCDIDQFYYVTYMDISYCIPHLPEEFGHLNKLLKLHLDFNRLSTLPEELSKLTSLTDLNISYNNLSTLPEWFSKLTSLKYLDISDNKFSQIPDSIFSLVNLSRLNISGNNHINNISRQIKKLTFLDNLLMFRMNRNAIMTTYKIKMNTKISISLG